MQVLAPSGIVVGLRIPGATEKFAELLEEESLDLTRGDVLVFYTDGITEAMNVESDLFGDARLGRLVRSTATSSRASSANASSVRSRRSSAAPISTTT